MKWPDNQIGVSGPSYLRSDLDFGDNDVMIRERKQTMNQQPSEAVGQIWALIFVFGVAVFAIKAFLEAGTKKQEFDLFTIGYIENNNTPTPITHSTTNNYKSTNNTTNVYKAAKIPKNNKITKLQLDCIDTLIAVGYKKMVARKMVLDYFKNHTPASVQQFISDVLKK